MKALICGSRDWIDESAIFGALKTQFAHDPDLAICHGAARGADRMAGKAAKELGIPVTEFLADWSIGRPAGIIRNEWMLREFQPDYVLAFSDHIENSVGTRHMCRHSLDHGVKVTLIEHGAGGLLFSRDLDPEDVKL